MNSRQIEVFHTVMKMGTVTEAAAKLGITQPAVTASLKQIEAALGFNLFHRAGGRLHPTGEARILFNEAERIQDSLMVFQKLADRLKHDLTTHLRIAAPSVFSHDLIPDAIADFTAEEKSCLIDVTTQHHDEILEDIASNVGHNNLGITFGLDEASAINGGGQLGSILIGKSQLVALVPADWPIANRTNLLIEDLTALPMVGTFSGEPLGNAVETLVGSSTGNTSGTNHIVRVQNHSVAANLASNGVGVAIIDSVTAAYAQRYFKGRNFKIRRIKNAPALDVTAVYSYEHPLNKHAKRFIDIFRKYFKGLQP